MWRNDSDCAAGKGYSNLDGDFSVLFFSLFPFNSPFFKKLTIGRAKRKKYIGWATQKGIGTKRGDIRWV